MNFGDGFSVPQDRGFQFMGYWMPETPDKPVATRSIPVLVDGHGMRVANWQELPGDQGGYDWQELPGVQGGYAHQPPTYRGGQSFNSVQQLGRSGSCCQLSAGLVEGNILLNHIADSCTQPISDPIENLLVANNAAPITSVNRNVVGGMGMANEPLIRSLLTTNNTTPVAYVNRSLGSDTGMATGPLIADLLGAQNAASVAAVNRTPSIYMGMANRGMPNLLAAKNTAPAASIYRIPVSDMGMANTPLIPNFLATKNAAALASVNQAPASNMGLVNRPLMSNPLGNVAPVTSVNTIPPGEMSMARRLLTPNLNTQVDHWGDFITDNLLLGDPTRGSSSNLFSQSGSLHHVFQDGFPIPYRPLYDLNSPPRTAVDANSSLAASFHLTPVTPDQAKRLENNEPCVALNFSTGSSGQEKENQDNLVTTRDEAPRNNGDQLLQNIVESSTVNSTPVKEQKELERGSDAGVDLNKTPQQKPAKRKRHRPKVVVEGNAKRTPKPATPKNPTMTEKPTGRRKYVRKTILKESATQQADLMREMADPGAELAAKSCRKALHFDLEKAEEDEVVGQMEKQHKKERACNSDSDSKPIELLSMASCESRKKSALQISQQSELPVGNHQIGTIGNYTSSLNQMTTENISLSERAAEGDSLHIEVFNTITRNLSTINADSCQRSRKNWSSAVHQNIHAERSSQIDFQVRNNCENLDRATQLQPQSTLQSAPNIFSNHNETRRSKRQFGHAIDKMHPCKIIPTVSSLMCQEMNESDINRSNPGASCLGVQKKKKTEDELHTNTSGMLSHTTAEENGLGQPISKGVNNVDANGFESPRNHETSVQRREHNEVNSPPRDWYVHTKANRYDWLMQQISLEQQSQTKGIGETNWLTEAQNFANNKKSNLIPPTPPRKAPAFGNGLVVSVANASKKQTVEHTQSKLVPSGRGSALGEQKKLQHAYQQSSGGRTGPPVEQAYPNLMDEIIHRFEGLYISHRHQKALVPYKGNGALIPHEGIKNPRPRARVELDAETNRVWNLLMGKKRTEDDEALDKEKEKWWEEERRVFRGRADSFIARMHLVQGDRRFSKWKGSVVDSVIGVFLTQNVSDHLSSSAFMSLVAKFPPKSKCSGTCDRALTNILVEEPEVCVLNPYCTIRWHEVGNHPSDKKSPLTADESKEHQRNSENSGTETTSLGETCSQSFEDALSSQDSFDSSILQPNGGIRSYSGSNSDAEYPTTANILNNTHWSSKETLMQNATLFHELYSHVNGSLLLHSGLQHGYMQSRTLENVQQHMTSGPQIHEIENFENYNQEPRHFWPSVAAEAHNRKDFTKMTAQHNGIPRTQEALTMGLYSLSSKQFMHRENVSQRGACTSCNHLCNHHQCEANKTFQLQDTPVIGPFNPAKTFLRSQSSTMQPILNVEERINTRRSSAESNSMEPEHHTVKAHNETDTHVSKAKRGKSQDDKKNAIEWDDLRKQVQANDRKKESKETMDSLDYEAMRCADVKRISEAIEERGMNNMLAERIQDFLNRLVREHGSIDLEWLRDVPPDKAKEYLLSIRGLGLKSVECVRLLTLHHLAFPVDTNVGRIAVRLGWVPIQPLPESLQIHLLELYPIQDAVQKYLWPRLCKLDQRTLYELHYQLITFGKVFCTKKKPNCNACPMRGECRHFASAYASARLALPGPEDKSITSPAVPTMPKIRPVTVTNAMQLPYPEKNSIRESRSCEPIIEEPATPEPDCTEISETDIEDTFSGDDEIPTIKLNVTEFSANVQHYLQENMELQGADMSKALVALSAEAAYIPTPKLKNVSRLRTEHQVYELPDSHPLLKDVDRREPDDPSPYLLAIWTPGETVNSVQPPEQRCGFQEPGKLCDDETCFSCNSIKEANSQTVRATLLIPCRTAMRGSFPLNGTYFQVNEVFADHASSINPIDVPREWIWNLPRRLVYFGTSVTTIFRGLSTEGIQYCFWKGFVCVRGFDQKKRAPRPLQGRLHYAASKLAKKKSESKHVSKDKLKVSKLAKKKSERNK